MSIARQHRQEVAEALAAALPGLPVHAYPPGNVSAPCAFIALGAAVDQPLATKWETQLHVTLVAPAGDNEAAVELLEEMIEAAAAALTVVVEGPVLWDEPGTAQIAGNSYLAARLTIPIDIEH
jgi:hypothetical protein